jgi:hypothetical protein
VAPHLRRPRAAVVGALVLVFCVLALVGCRLLGRRQGPMLDDIFRPKAKECTFTDIEDDPAEQVIRTLAELGVLESFEGPFWPTSPVLRGEFVTWLVRANNIFFRDEPAMWVPLASRDEPKIYMDVPPHEPCFPYVNGMLNAGYPLSFETREFNYQHDLSREQLVFIRDGLCLGPDAVLGDPVLLDEDRVRLRSFLEDADAVTEHYVPAIISDLAEGDTIKLAFGGTDTLSPRKAATRSEAALALSELRGRTCQQAVDEVLPKWVPLPESAQKELEEAQQAEEAEEADEHSH